MTDDDIRKLYAEETGFLLDDSPADLLGFSRALLRANAGQVPEAMAVVIEALRNDLDYAWSWHCNVAMAAVDEGMEHHAANCAASRFMWNLANVDTTKHPGFPTAPTQPEQPSAERGGDAEWDGKLNDRLQKAINALRLECPAGVVNDFEHIVRESFRAVYTDKATLRHMLSAALASRPAEQPAPVQGEVPPGKNWHAHHVIVSKAALQMVRNALRTDLLDGKAVRGEMLEELDKVTYPVPAPSSPPVAQDAQQGLKDHQIRELVNQVRDIALQFHDHQSLRERLARVLVPVLRAARSLPTSGGEPVATAYVSCRECANCGHIGINDEAAGTAACSHCDWSGPEPSTDHCEGCGQDGTMSAACPKCGSYYSLFADATIATTPTSAGEDGQYRLLTQRDIIEAADEFLSDDTKTWAPDPNAIFVGMPYGGGLLRPARRRINAADGAGGEGL